MSVWLVILLSVRVSYCKSAGVTIDSQQMADVSGPQVPVHSVHTSSDLSYSILPKTDYEAENLKREN